LPAILLAADLAGEWWRRNVEHFGRQQLFVAVLALAGTVNAVQGWRLCFVHPTNPGELLVYNHTQPALGEIGRDMRRELAATKGQAAPLIQGDALWPLAWYIHGYSFVAGMGQPGWTSATLAVCDKDYPTTSPAIRRRFRLEARPFRCAFVPAHAPLHLFTFLPPRAEGEEEVRDEDSTLTAGESSEEGVGTIREGKRGIDRSLYGFGAWRTLARYIVFRVPWAPRLTADPLKVLYGPLRRREGEGREPPHSPEGP